MKNVNDTNPMCFGCGKNNPIGLHMHFKVDENGCSSHFTPETIEIVTKVKRRKGLLLEMTGEVIRPDGTVAAEADAKMMYEGER